MDELNINEPDEVASPEFKGLTCEKMDDTSIWLEA